MKTKYYWLLFYCVFFGLSSRGQDSTLGSWNILHMDVKFNNSWSMFVEGQIRSLRFYNHFHYYEYKGALVYDLQENSTLALGFGQYRTYSEGGTFLDPIRSDELRLWPQFILNQKIKRLRIEHRYRAEFRFTNNGFRNRFRLRFGVSHPIFDKQITKGHLSIRANNELFFTNRAPYFERNRSQIQFVYQLNKEIEFQLGYLHQFDYQIIDETGRDFLVVGFVYKLDLRKD